MHSMHLPLMRKLTAIKGSLPFLATKSGRDVAIMGSDPFLARAGETPTLQDTMIDLSIILPTCNRATLLERSIRAITSHLPCHYELIVVDGASTDDTASVLKDAQDLLGDKLKIIREDRREGFVKAANKGFLAARGRCMTWLNDDARPLGDSLINAMSLLETAPLNVAFVAMFHRWAAKWNVAYETTFNWKSYQLCHVRGTLYANFCVGLRETYHRLGYFDERFHFFGADPDLSLKAWHAGMRIIPGFGSCIDHDQHEDDRREADASRGQEDNAKLFDKWELPPRNPTRNDFDPGHPCTLIGLKSKSLAA